MAEGLTLSTLITDRHPQIQKLVRETMPAVSHFYDVWHVAKGLRKKLEALAKEKDCEALSPWIKSIVNHLYWCAASTPHEDPELVLQKWRSVINHVQSIHVGHGARYNECQHPLEGSEAPKKKWLKCGTKAAEKLGLLLEKPRLLKDVRKISPQYQTSAVESFHRVIINFAPKMVGFSYMGMLSRLYLSAMHFNENGTRPQAHDDNGEFKFRIKYKKYRKGQHVLTKATSDMTHDYVGRLLTEVCKQARQSREHRATTSHIVVPVPLTSQFPRINMDQAIQSHLSRFNN